jgi:hypothetical protein
VTSEGLRTTQLWRFGTWDVSAGAPINLVMKINVCRCVVGCEVVSLGGFPVEDGGGDGESVEDGR